MRLALVGTILALSVAAASAQSTAPQVVGNKAFCLKGTSKVECSFDSMAACQKSMAQSKSQDTTSAGTCINRSEAR
jgi:hypothetical protein